MSKLIIEKMNKPFGEIKYHIVLSIFYRLDCVFALFTEKEACTADRDQSRSCILVVESTEIVIHFNLRSTISAKSVCHTSV